MRDSLISVVIAVIIVFVFISALAYVMPTSEEIENALRVMEVI